MGMKPRFSHFVALSRPRADHARAALPRAHPHPPVGGRGDGPTSGRAPETAAGHRATRSALCHPTRHRKLTPGATAPRACRLRVGIRRVAARQRSLDRGHWKIVRHPPAGPAPITPAPPSARRTSPIRAPAVAATGDWRGNGSAASGCTKRVMQRGPANFGHPVVIPRAPAPRACRPRAGVPATWPPAYAPSGSRTSYPRIAAHPMTRLAELPHNWTPVQA